MSPLNIMKTFPRLVGSRRRAAAALLALCPGCVAEQPPLNADDVLARVLDEVVTVADYRSYAQRLPAAARADVDPERIVQAIVDEKLILAEGRRLGLDGGAEYRELVQQHTRRLSLGELYRRQGIVRRQPSEEELLAFFAASPYSRRVRFSLLMVRDPDLLPPLIEQLEAGAHFEAVSMKHSQDHRILMRKADMGYHRWGETMPSHEAIAAKAFTMSPGQMAGPLRAADGWFLIKVTDVHPVSLEQERETVTKLWLQEQLASQLAVYCDTLEARYALAFDEEGLDALWSALTGDADAPTRVVAELSEGTLTVATCLGMLEGAGPQALDSPAAMRRVLVQRICREVLMLQEIGRLDLVNSAEVKSGLAEARRKVLLDLIKRRIAQRLPPPNSSLVKLHFDTHPEDYREPEQVVTRRLSTPDADSAGRIVEELEAGVDTAAVLDRFVEVTYPAMAGDSPMARALRSAAGSVHGPLAEEAGFAVLQILARRPSRVPDLDEVQERVLRDLLVEQQAEVFERFVAELRASNAERVEILTDLLSRLRHG